MVVRALLRLVESTENAERRPQTTLAELPPALVAGLDAEGVAGLAAGAAEVEAGEVEDGEVEAGEVEAGEVEAGEVEAGEVEAGREGSTTP
ncbi:hypothetical protein [Intrasporangium calvum]|uniref:hypothetical protein n=1 Tax=Intrasporangium calvum TaxID=53358 RepID=UPI000DF60A55|nr:hypothetical protein [Intrasporangium calvum]AXG14048.1 hypothetical protein DN585_12130 [Intrasporangium calvum]